MVATLDVLGGLGKGVMTGERFVQDRDYRQAQLDALNAEASYKQQQRQLQEDERQRLASLDAISREVNSPENIKTMSAYDRSKLSYEQMLPYLKANDIEPALKNMDALFRTFGQETIRKAIMSGDWGEVNRMGDGQFRVIMSGADGKQILAELPNGQAITLGRDDMESMLGVHDAVAAQARKKEELDLRKKLADIESTNALTGQRQSASKLNERNANHVGWRDKSSIEADHALTEERRARARQANDRVDNPDNYKNGRGKGGSGGLDSLVNGAANPSGQLPGSSVDFKKEQQERQKEYERETARQLAERYPVTPKSDTRIRHSY